MIYRGRATARWHEHGAPTRRVGAIDIRRRDAHFGPDLIFFVPNHGSVIGLHVRLTACEMRRRTVIDNHVTYTEVKDTVHI